MIVVEISDRDARATAIAEQIDRAVKLVLADAGVTSGDVSVAVVDDATIWRLNREYLEHDYPTDVLSFLLSREGARLEGEIIVSVDTAARESVEHALPADDELLLYVVHGALHLVGFEDSTDDQRHQMRQCEREVLSQLGVALPGAREHQSIASGAARHDA